MSSLFVKTISLRDGEPLKAIKPGQWVQFAATGNRGQYLGTTARGTDCIRWQSGKFACRDAKGNKHLRAFAKTYGSP